MVPLNDHDLHILAVNLQFTHLRTIIDIETLITRRGYMRIIVSSLFAILMATVSHAATPRGAMKQPAAHNQDMKTAAESLQLHVKPMVLFDAKAVLVGPSVALEIPVVKYFSLGAMINANMVPMAPFTAVLDFDAFAKGYYSFKIGNYDASVSATIPLGYSLLVQSAFNRSTSSHGFNFGVVPGFEFYFNRHWGMFTELGFSAHVFSSTLIPNGQFGIGVTYAF